MENKVELLAPAGSLDGFYGAIHAGADAVYMGGRAFGARAYAENFTDDELILCIKYAHLWNRKVYLTVNTLVKEREFEELYQYIKPLYEAGLDGIIVQDIGVLAFCQSNFPGLLLHASTQMTITGANGAAFLKQLGVNRIVPARELSLKEIIRLKNDSGMEVECFVHGAMCYCFSGQCLFSSILGGRSGNRGRCAQPCRLPYNIDKNDKKELYPLSLKDMCTIEMLPNLIEAHIDSFKIEGRMKKPEYTAGVTAIYRKYIDLYYSDKTYKVDEKDLKTLQLLYLRTQREQGYYNRHNGKEMVTLTNPSYLPPNQELLDHIRQKYITNRPKKPLKVYIILKIGQKSYAKFTYNDITVTVVGSEVQTASTSPITLENVKKQMQKLGETPFVLDDLCGEIDNNVFFSLKELNEIRRQGIQGILEKLDSKYLRNSIRDEVSAENDFSNNIVNHNGALKRNGDFSILVQTSEQLTAVKGYLNAENSNANSKIDTVYVEHELILKNEDVLQELLDIKNQEYHIIIALPQIIRNEFYNKYEALTINILNMNIFDGVLIRNVESLAWLLKHDYMGYLIADACFYTWNHYAFDFVRKYVKGVCLPYELKKKEKSELIVGGNDLYLEQVVYGRIPLMVTANCVEKTCNICRKKKKEDYSEFVSLSDRYKTNFPVKIQCAYCMNTIYNSVALSLHKDLNDIKRKYVARIQLSNETYQETMEILSYFSNVTDGKNPPWKEFTTGYEKRGVE